MKKAIIQTLAYADVFDYPLIEKEIWRYLIAEKKISSEIVQKELCQKYPQIVKTGEYFFLKNRHQIVKIRQVREKWSRGKLKIAQRVAGWLRLIPWIKMVGVTGALAMNNSDKDDDIDLLITTSKNRLWLTRLLATIIIELVASRRRPDDQKFRDKICLNMFLDEKHLAVPKKEQDLFTAHEVVQMKPIWEKDNTYQKFLKANIWVKKYLPNWKP